MVRRSRSAGHRGTSEDGDLSSYADVVEKCCSYLLQVATPGDVGTAMTSLMPPDRLVFATA
jgi:hypothetical protein